jgi:hypothetical protein
MKTNSNAKTPRRQESKRQILSLFSWRLGVLAFGVIFWSNDLDG